MIAIHLVTSTLLGLATASALPVAEGAQIATSQPTAAAQGASAPPVRVKRYCIKDRRDGADIRPKICRTRDEWRARGFDPAVAIGEI
ncbi:hypothetical protein [uncultured Sphingomonas sp.]|uniref:hypothetical protein n=1 Tax=uncultured Sphingomonas sp. TaxID=158754 RepID=UPI0025F285CC|nr:hypothetical protein [uncultured Sphingomonas sp.]